ncbi:GTPase-activating protein gyp1 [Psilocybe cubensis]|uniref:GTPase-activating protein gyp1 n=2 Tax=Psilocybe cubensis TaxID=181762 RepID=A0ACB8HCX6_PSICU|nr:GTPase-activating protein gyp1 [Psilocybe cubensis]KAH9485567.1 GTPase-activating protein gyp1 [Psilocybe cubensis]
MNPRSPPARPHIGIHSSHFSKNADWGEDDAWDSTSDSESPRQSTLNSSWNRPPAASSTTAPKMVPRTSSNSSSSTLAFSYTHLQAPSSYPPKSDNSLAEAAPKNGWTMIRTSHGGKDGEGQSTQRAQTKDGEYDRYSTGSGDLDVEGDMILGDLEPEANATDTNDAQIPLQSKPKHNYGSIRLDIDDIVTDPLNGIINRSRLRGSSPLPTYQSENKPIPSTHQRERSEKILRENSIRSNRRHKFVECLSSQDVNISELRKLAWAGIPNDLRPMAWQLLLGYLPLPTPLRSSTLKRKRGEYQNMVDLAFARGREGLDQQIWHQIEIDVPRTRPGVRLWMHETTQRSLERILYVWAIRHPASGYVQGINDLVTPFFQVFLSAYIDSEPEEFDTSLLPSHALLAIEADSFWCLSRLLDGIQDNYIFAQPGIQRSVRRMAELVARIDAPLSAHLESQNVEFMQFAFRWMNCLLMREISVQNTIRMWDTYLAEGPDAFSQFHLYVCSAFLVRWSDKLRKMDFQGIIMFLQSLPTQDWGDHEIEMLLSEAFVLNSIWHNAQSHFNGK